MKRLLPLLFVCVSALLSAQATVRYASVKVSLTGKTLAELVRVGVETEHALIYPGRSITLVLSELELEKVKQAGFVTEVLIPDLTAHYLDQAQNAPEVQNRDGNCNLVVEESSFQTPVNYSYGTMGGYLTYAQILAELDKMHTLFPDLVSERKNVSETIQTWEGRKLQYVKISDNAAADEPEREVLYTALHHAREP
ncbi:MAG: hypothetical protein JNJ57_08100, partial [Saprospiraceae bacterium]|nr:hypothetical protein [Saprospiraceae bacterium]